MTPRAARIIIFAICIWIIVVGLGSVALALMGVTWSLVFGGTISGVLGLLWLAAWAVYHRWA